MNTKHIICLLCALLLGAATMMAAGSKDDKKVAKIEFATKTHDFGTIKEADGNAVCEFEFRNTGDAPLVIISATAACGCTRPQYPTTPVKPGRKGKIKVSYNPANRPGEFNKTVTVRTNAPSQKKVTLRISGTVIPDK